MEKYIHEINEYQSKNPIRPRLMSFWRKSKKKPIEPKENAMTENQDTNAK